MPTSTWIILIIAAVIAGYVIGLVDRQITSRLWKKKEAPEEKAGAESGPTAEAQPGRQTVMRVTQDEQQEVHLELDGVPLEDPARMSAEQRKRAIHLVVLIRPWLEVNGAAKAADVRAAPRPAAAVPVSAPAKEARVADADALKIDPLRGFRTLLNNDIRPNGETGLSGGIVSMIDEILQEKLKDSPLRDKAIRLEEGSLGEVIVCVGHLRYQGVDAVENAEVRGILRQAIADWEKR